MGCSVWGLWGLKFLPACFALLNGEAYSTGNVVPIGAKPCVRFQLNKADVCICVPGVPICIFVEWWWGLALALGLWYWW